MTAQSSGVVATAVEQTQSLGNLIAQHQDDFRRVLPTRVRADHWVRLAQGVLRRNQKLAEAARANPGSLLAVMLDCARLGHEPGTDQYAIVVYGGEITGIEQYQGQIERMYRSGAIRTVRVEVVRENDLYEYRPDCTDKPRHEKGWFCSTPAGSHRHARFLSAEKRGELVGVHAHAEFFDGGISQVVEMGRDEVMLHREAAKTKKVWDGPWEPSMWKKSAIHELAKFVPTSAEDLRGPIRASSGAHRLRPSIASDASSEAVNDGGVIDAELIEPESGPVEAGVVRS